MPRTSCGTVFDRGRGPPNCCSKVRSEPAGARDELAARGVSDRFTNVVRFSKRPLAMPAHEARHSDEKALPCVMICVRDDDEWPSCACACSIQPLLRAVLIGRDQVIAASLRQALRPPVKVTTPYRAVPTSQLAACSIPPPGDTGLAPAKPSQPRTLQGTYARIQTKHDLHVHILTRAQPLSLSPSLSEVPKTCASEMGSIRRPGPRPLVCPSAP